MSWLSEAWVRGTGELASPQVAGLEGTIEVVVRGIAGPGEAGEEPEAGGERWEAAADRPRGRGGRARTKAVPEAHYHRVLVDGRVVASAVGTPPSADVTLTVADDDAQALLRGELDPAVAFMRGSLKTSGDPGLVLRLLEAWSTEEARQARIMMGERAGLVAGRAAPGTR